MLFCAIPGRCPRCLKENFPRKNVIFRQYDDDDEKPFLLWENTHTY